jgi:hypothetical protein
MEFDILFFEPGRSRTVEVMAPDLPGQVGSKETMRPSSVRAAGLPWRTWISSSRASREKVLAWVQGFHYEPNFAGIDLVLPLTAAFERGGDCDSRDCTHAMPAVDAPGGGQRFTCEGKGYLVAEMTAHVGIGMTDSSQADLLEWLGADVGEE